MTGFGTAAIENAAISATASVRSVNHRYLDITFHLGAGLVALERDIRTLLESRLGRGRIEVRVRAVLGEGATTTVEVVHPMVEGWLDAFREMRSRHKLPGTVSAWDMARLPGVTEVGEPTLGEGQSRAIVELVGRALDQLEAMRKAEGSHLADHILRCLAAIEQAVGGIEAVAAGEREPRLAGLLEKVRGLVQELGLEEARVYAEVARLVDRSEISEEVERLRSHVALARKLVDAEDAPGKRLDFLAQELMREANTIGSKSSSAPLTHEVVSLKGEIERFREQVQNVE